MQYLPCMTLKWAVGSTPLVGCRKRKKEGTRPSPTLYIVSALHLSKKKTAHFRVRCVLALPIFPGRPTYCHAVRNSPVDCSRRKKRARLSSDSVCWRYLSSRVGQVLSWRRKCPVDTFRQNCKINQKKTATFRLRSLCWRYLSSRAVARQVLSAQMSLTSVFGMGTGGPSLQSTPTHMDGFEPIFYINAPSGFLPLVKLGDPYRIRTDVNGVRGRCLNHLTNGPWCTFRDSNPGPTD